MGNINFINGALEDAITSYSNAIELLEGAADKARLWKRVGDVHQRLEETDDANAAYQKAAELDPKKIPAGESAARVDPVQQEGTPESIEENVEEMDLQLSPAVDAAAPAEADLAGPVLVEDAEQIPAELPALAETTPEPDQVEFDREKSCAGGRS